jgi:anti-sigma regulatory factor (Ser/Thr protein kinase)
MALNLTAAYAVEDSSQVGGPRRAALDVAQRSGFSEERAGQVALIASELASNLAKHAKGGELLLRAFRNEGGAGPADGIEILAIDRGPGLPDVALARQDGYSTAGTLGHGLGSIERLSHFFQIYSRPSGTVAVSCLWRDHPAPAARKPLYEIGAVLVSYPGEDVCGDAWGWTVRDDRVAIMVADGLGHGLSAHEAAVAAIDVFHQLHEHIPSETTAGLGISAASSSPSMERATAWFLTTARPVMWRAASPNSITRFFPSRWSSCFQTASRRTGISPHTLGFKLVTPA